MKLVGKKAISIVAAVSILFCVSFAAVIANFGGVNAGAQEIVSLLATVTGGTAVTDDSLPTPDAPTAPNGFTTLGVHKVDSVIKNTKVSLASQDKNLKDYNRLFMYVRTAGLSDSTTLRLQVMSDTQWNEAPVPFDVTVSNNQWVLVTLNLKGTKLQEFMNGTKRVGAYALWTDFSCTSLYISSVFAVKEVVETTNLTNLLNQVAGYQSDMFAAAGWADFTQARTAAQDVLAKTNATQQEMDSAYETLDTAVKALQAVFRTLATPKSDSGTALTQVTDSTGILAKPSGVSDITAYKTTGVAKNKKISLTANDKNLIDYTRLFMYVRADHVNGSIGSIRIQVMDNVTWGGDPVPFDAMPVSDKWLMLTLDLTGTKLKDFMNGTKQVGGYSLYIDFACDTLYISSVYAVTQPVDFDRANLTDFVNQVTGYQSDMFKSSGWAEFTQARTAAQDVLANASASSLEVDSAYKNLDTAVKALQADFVTLATPKSDSTTTVTQVTDATGIVAAPSGITGLTAYKAASITNGRKISLTAVDKNLKNYTRLFMYVRADGVTNPIGSIRLEVMDNVSWSGIPVPFDAMPVSDKWVMLTLDLTGTKLQSFMNGTKQVGGYALWIDFACTSLYVSSVYAVKQPVDFSKVNLTNLVNQVIGYQDDIFGDTGWAEFTQARTAAQDVLANASASSLEVDSAYKNLDTAVKALQADFVTLATPKSDSTTTVTQVTDATGIVAVPSGITGLTAYKAASITNGRKISLTAVDKNLKNYTRLFMYVRADGVTNPIGSIRLEVMDNVTWSGIPVPFDAMPVSDKWVMLTLDLTGTKLQSFMNGTKQVGGYSLWIDFGCSSLYVSSVYAVKGADKSDLINLVNQAKGYKQEKFAANGWIAFAEKLAAAQLVLDNISATQEEVNAAYMALDLSMKALEPLFGQMSYILATTKLDVATPVDLEGLNVPETPAGLKSFPIYKAVKVKKDQKINLSAADKNLQNYERLYVYVRADSLSLSTLMRLQVMSPPNWNDTPVYFDVTLMEDKWVKLTIDLKGAKLKDYINGTKQTGGYALWVDFNCDSLYISDLCGEKEVPMDTLNKIQIKELVNQVKDFKQELYAMAGWAEFQNALRTAQQIIDNTSAKKSEVDAAFNALKAAAAALIPTSKDVTEILGYTRLDKVGDSVLQGLHVPKAPEELENYTIYSVNNVKDSQDIRFSGNDLDIAAYYRVYVYVRCEGYAGGGLSLQLLDKKTWSGPLVGFSGKIVEGEWSLLSVDLSASALKAFMDGTSQVGGYSLWAYFTCNKLYISDLYGIKTVSTKISTTKLEERVRRAERLCEEDYTIASWVQFKKALADSKKVLELEEIMDQSIVDNALNHLEEMWSYLELYKRNLFAEIGTLIKDGKLTASGVNKNKVSVLDFGQFPVETRSALFVSGWDGTVSNLVKLSGLTLDLTDLELLEFYVKSDNLIKDGKLILTLYSLGNTKKSVELALKIGDNGKGWIRQEVFLEDFGLTDEELDSIIALSFSLENTKGDVVISSIYANGITLITANEVPFVKYPMNNKLESDLNDYWDSDEDEQESPGTGDVLPIIAALMFLGMAGITIVSAKKSKA